MLPVLLKPCWCPVIQTGNCFLLMLRSRAFYLILAGVLLRAYSIEAGSREQTVRELEWFRIFPQIAGSRKMQGCHVWWDLKIAVVDSTPPWLASRNMLSCWANECEVYLIHVQSISYYLSNSPSALKSFKIAFFHLVFWTKPLILMWAYLIRDEILFQINPNNLTSIDAPSSTQNSWI